LNAGENPEMGPHPVNVLCKQVLTDGAYSLHTVLLENCSIADQGASYLSQALTQDKCRLRFLDLSQNFIGPEGAYYISQGLFKN
jgi:hypothetical protein